MKSPLDKTTRPVQDRNMKRAIYVGPFVTFPCGKFLSYGMTGFASQSKYGTLFFHPDYNLNMGPIVYAQDVYYTNY